VLVDIYSPGGKYVDHTSHTKRGGGGGGGELVCGILLLFFSHISS
jgi:hypothetical protein